MVDCKPTNNRLKRAATGNIVAKQLWPLGRIKNAKTERDFFERFSETNVIMEKRCVNRSMIVDWRI